MVKAIEVIFWCSAVVISYTYIGYPLLLQLFSSPRKPKSNDHFPELTIVVPVHNEEKFIADKINNCLSLKYPSTVKLLFVNDGSTDATASIIRNHPQAELITLENRLGKTNALNHAMERVKTELVVFTDANCLLDENCLKHLAVLYADEKVGGVSGEKKIFSVGEGSAVSSAEKLYWQYESFLKKAEASFYSIVGADGGLYSIRTGLFQRLDKNVILDDFFISSRVCEQGYQFLYEPKAFAVETSSTSIKEEHKRKVRISAGCFQALFQLKQLLNPLGNFRLFVVYLSHRVLRWAACPLLLPILLAANVALCSTTDNQFYLTALLLQGAFYLLALAAALFPGFRRWQALMVPYYFVFMNLSIYEGCFRYMRQSQPAAWEKTERQLFK